MRLLISGERGTASLNEFRKCTFSCSENFGAVASQSDGSNDSSFIETPCKAVEFGLKA